MLFALLLVDAEGVGRQAAGGGEAATAIARVTGAGFPLGKLFPLCDRLFEIISIQRNYIEGTGYVRSFPCLTRAPKKAF